VILEGQVTRGRFGTSVANLGDIDDDGYEGVCMRCDCASEAVTVCVKLLPCMHAFEDRYNCVLYKYHHNLMLPIKKYNQLFVTNSQHV